MAQADTGTGAYGHDTDFNYEESHLRDVVALIDSDIRKRRSVLRDQRTDQT